MDYISLLRSKPIIGESLYQATNRAGICSWFFLLSTEIETTNKCSTVLVVTWSASSQVYVPWLCDHSQSKASSSFGLRRFQTKQCGVQTWWEWNQSRIVVYLTVYLWSEYIVQTDSILVQPSVFVCKIFQVFISSSWGSLAKGQRHEIPTVT